MKQKRIKEITTQSLPSVTRPACPPPSKQSSHQYHAHTHNSSRKVIFTTCKNQQQQIIIIIIFIRTFVSVLFGRETKQQQKKRYQK